MAKRLYNWLLFLYIIFEIIERIIDYVVLDDDGKADYANCSIRVKSEMV